MIEKYVVSLDLAKKLKEVGYPLGIRKESARYCGSAEKENRGEQQ